MSRMPGWASAIAVLVGGAVALLALTLGLSGQPYAMRLATSFALLLALATSWNLVGGFTGYPSFATSAFFGLGAYASGVLQTSLLWPWWSGLAAGACAAALLAAPFGFAILRLRGHYFAIASLMLISILRELTTGWASVTGGGMGLNVPGAVGDPDALARFGLLVLGSVAIAGLALSAYVAGSRLGFGLRCIRMNETGAAGAGIDAPRLKSVAFTLSAAVAGAAGGAYAGWIGYIDPSDVYDVMWSVRPIVAAMIGGAGMVFGPLLGSAIYALLEEVLWRGLLDWSTGALGIFVVLLLLVAPQGILPSLTRGRRWRLRSSTVA